MNDSQANPGNISYIKEQLSVSQYSTTLIVPRNDTYAFILDNTGAIPGSPVPDEDVNAHVTAPTAKACGLLRLDD